MPGLLQAPQRSRGRHAATCRNSLGSWPAPRSRRSTAGGVASGPGGLWESRSRLGLQRPRRRGNGRTRTTSPRRLRGSPRARRDVAQASAPPSAESLPKSPDRLPAPAAPRGAGCRRSSALSFPNPLSPHSQSPAARQGRAERREGGSAEAAAGSLLGPCRRLPGAARGSGEAGWACCASPG